MKLSALNDRESLLNEAIGNATSDTPFSFFNDMSVSRYDDLENAYNDFERLQTAFDTGNFGSLIGRKANEVTERDITVIKNTILQILIDNPFLRGQNFDGKSGQEVMRLLGLAIGHGIEAILLAILHGAFVGATLKEVLSGNKLLAALSGAGAVFTGAALPLQLKTIKAVWAAYKLVKIVDTYQAAASFDASSYHRGFLRAFIDFVDGKTPDQIKADTQKRIEAAAMEKQLKFEHAMRNLPQTFPYRDSKGMERDYPTYKLFEFQ